MSDVTRVKVTEIDDPVIGPIDVYAGDDGHWYASVGDLHLNEISFDSLRRNISTAVKTHKVEVPFVSAFGRKGVMRALHASTGQILVTWDDGKKGRLDRYTRVFPDGSIDEGDLGLLKLAIDEREQADARIVEYQKLTVQAKDLYASEVAEDLVG